MLDHWCVGQRVAAYGICDEDGWHARMVGEITDIGGTDLDRLWFREDTTETTYMAMRRQCRRLKPRRTHQEVWINNKLLPNISLQVGGSGLMVTCVDRMGDPEWTHFREVLK